MKQTTHNGSPTRAGRWLLPLLGLAAVTGLILGLGLGRAHAAPGNDISVPAPIAPRQQEQIAGATLQYLRIAGSAFVPFTSSLAFTYSGSGCIHKSGGTETRVARKPVLPAGSIVKFVRM